MADYRTVKVEFWSDPWTEDLTPKEKFLYLYLFTNQYVTNCGVMKLSEKKIAFETGLPRDEINEIFTMFQEEKKVVRDKDYILLVNFIRHQSSTSPMILKNIASEMEKIGSQEVINTLLIEYSHLEIPYRKEEVEVEGEDKEEVEGDAPSLRFKKIHEQVLGQPYRQLKPDERKKVMELDQTYGQAEVDECWRCFLNNLTHFTDGAGSKTVGWFHHIIDDIYNFTVTGKQKPDEMTWEQWWEQEGIE